MSLTEYMSLPRTSEPAALQRHIAVKAFVAFLDSNHHYDPDAERISPLFVSSVNEGVALYCALLALRGSDDLAFEVHHALSGHAEPDEVLADWLPEYGVDPKVVAGDREKWWATR